MSPTLSEYTRTVRACMAPDCPSERKRRLSEAHERGELTDLQFAGLLRLHNLENA